MNNPKKKIALSVIGAAAIGTAVYILLSSDKGSETRKKIADTFSDIACKVGEYFTQTKDKAQAA